MGVVEKGAPGRGATRVRPRGLLFRRVLSAAGLVVAGWSTVRVARLLSGDESVVPDDDPHGYRTIFSLVLLPFLAAAVIGLARETVAVWRSPGRPGFVAGLALFLSAPLAHPLVLPAVLLGSAIVAVALADRFRQVRALRAARAKAEPPVDPDPLR